LPDLPPIAQFASGYNGVGWFGLGAPKGTPAPIIEALRSAINAGIAEPDTKARFAKLGAEPMPTSLADFKKLIADETEKWGKVVRQANLKAE
jgi:tripartite-type tricarboxylate transporter receptor subunit TctC